MGAEATLSRVDEGVRSRCAGWVVIQNGVCAVRIPGSGSGFFAALRVTPPVRATIERADRVLNRVSLAYAFAHGILNTIRDIHSLNSLWEA